MLRRVGIDPGVSPRHRVPIDSSPPTPVPKSKDIDSDDVVPPPPGLPACGGTDALVAGCTGGIVTGGVVVCVCSGSLEFDNDDSGNSILHAVDKDGDECVPVCGGGKGRVEGDVVVLRGDRAWTRRVERRVGDVDCDVKDAFRAVGPRVVGTLSGDVLCV